MVAIQVSHFCEKTSLFLNELTLSVLFLGMVSVEQLQCIISYHFFGYICKGTDCFVDHERRYELSIILLHIMIWCSLSLKTS